jgi:hypothetical protein
MGYYDPPSFNVLMREIFFEKSPEYYQYWEYIEGTGEDTQTDPSVSG